LSSDVGIAFIYCNYKEHDSQTLTNLLGSIVKQLVQKLDVVPDDVFALYTQHASQKTVPGHGEFSKALQSLATSFSCRYIVIDALDECNATDSTRRLLINELQCLGPHLRLLCTSRRLGDIEEAFAASPSLEIRAVDKDVRTFLEAQISQDASLAAFCAKNRSLQSTIVGKVIEKAKGM
jgi:hypothetical protein